MIRRPPRSTRTTHSFPTRRSSDLLRASRERDQILGFTSVGPHRADWRMRFGKLTAREGLSRGQTKLAALACVLAQAQQFSVVRGYWPLVCLDDLARSEEHTSELQSLMRISYAVFCLKKKNNDTRIITNSPFTYLK